jgi:hypothetical protein
MTTTDLDLREELRTIDLRANQREAATQATIQTLTRQMVQMEAAFEARFDRIEARFDRIEARFDRIETLLADIARKLSA